MLAHLNIGSNQGDRHSNLERAIALIGLKAGAITAISDEIESPPWGYDSPSPYLNVGINVETSLSPIELLDTLQSIEREISTSPHRNPDGTYRDRIIDIDIIDIQGLTIDTPRLVIPHPRAHLRPFVLSPLHQIWNKSWLTSDE